MGEKLEVRIKKLLSLSKYGVGGEKENAEKFLANLLKKHGLTLDDIEENKTTKHFLKYGRGLFNKKLLGQVIYSVCGDIAIWRHKDKKSCLAVDCTESEKIEIEFKFNVYKKALNDELDIFYSAFIEANRIFPSKDKSCGQNNPDIDIDRLRKILGMVKNIDKTEIHNQITCNA